MNVNIRKTALAVAVASLMASPALFAQTVDDPNVSADILHNHVVVEDWDITVDETRNTTINDDTTISNTLNETYNGTTTVTDDRAYTWSSDVFENIERTENIQSDVRREGNSHQVSVSLEKDLSLSSDINFTGDPEITGVIDIDSAAIAVVDNRQSITGNNGYNDMLENDAAIGDDVAATASGNLGFNVAAGDNNTQDNAAALSAADASFAFGMADAEVFVNQYGADNITENYGVANTASISGAAFSGASGNIGVNVTSGNNNEQKNALAASVATAAYAQSSISSNQVSTGNTTDNLGSLLLVEDTMDFTLGGDVSGSSSGSGSGSYSGTGSSYQMANFYPDTWEGGDHASGSRIGHDDWDNEAQGAIENPNRPGVGGIAFDNDEAGDLDFTEQSDIDLVASLSGTFDYTYLIAVAATNSATLSGGAFSGASGNIGVNVASGTGNLQANSLALAVAQPRDRKSVV